ncbi:DoxX family protein [Aminobacter aganoensis]|uniref:Putative oxidoreductase n=1 Tax=Aminobacter aganoensis TaxID=83264 RepID=A0A7X0FBC1_9HYPH|nr:DoxX family protein [Aminobacter aganoensis]MBB6356525.1 putative oxidoreductase [Aminobacter aganoensis]
MQDQSATKLVLPGMGRFYGHVAQPFAFLGLRLVVGAMLVIEGWPKIQSPFAMAGFTEAIGFYPGWFWSAVLAALQFVGGLMILAGFLTRPVALANALMLAVTFWFHWSNPYGAMALTQEGIVAAQAAGQALFTADGIRNLAADGGAMFLHQVQFKAEGLSALWTVAALFLAAFGAGPLSVDRTLLKREF